MYKNTEKKAFDPTICFTCFSPWVEFIRNLSERDPAAALQAFFVIADFCLYDIEPAADNSWGLAWPIVEQQALRSIHSRRRGFGAENTVQTEAIKAYVIAHPGAPQWEIASAIGCSLTKVNKVMKQLRSVPPSSSIDDSPIVSDSVTVSYSSSGTNSGHDSLLVCPAEQNASEGKPCNL